MIRLFTFLLALSTLSASATTTINVTLDEACHASLGIYTTNGVMVRTLFSNQQFYGPGSFSTNWNNLDDWGNTVSNSTYLFKLAVFNINYVWNGAIGNTSDSQTGFGVHFAFYVMHDMAISSNNWFYVAGYNEGHYDFAQGVTNDYQAIASRWCPAGTANSAGIYDNGWDFAAADLTNVYFAAASSIALAGNKTNGFVLSGVIGHLTCTNFSSGVTITNTANLTYANGINVGTLAGLSGLAVEVYSNLLAASVYADNKVYFFDKGSGAAVRNITVSAPGRLCFTTNNAGVLWVATSNSLVCITNCNASPAISLTATNLSSPLAVGVSPLDPNIIMLADGGTNQMLFKYNSNGVQQASYGLKGGYQTNGPACATNKFWFQWDVENVVATFVTFAGDGSFWVGDGMNHRVMHFDGAFDYIDQIMSQPHSYSAGTDMNNPNHVFNQFLQFNVDYTKPIAQSWTLAYNWQDGNTNYNSTGNNGYGPRSIFTATNGRTYGMLANYAYGTGQQTYEQCELNTNTGLRLIPVFPGGTNSYDRINFATNGDVYRIVQGSSTWYKYSLTNFDGSFNPQYTSVVTIAYAPNGITNPIPNSGGQGVFGTAITSNGTVVAFDPSKNNNILSMHLGGVRLGDSNYLWQASPAGPLNNDGHFDTNTSYSGNIAMAVDRLILFGFHGEFFLGIGEAAQEFLYLDDGLFLGQFGNVNIGNYPQSGVIPAVAGNALSPALFSTTNGYRVAVNDESSHGVQEWTLAGAQAVREFANVGLLNATITLTNPTVNFPTAVTAIASNASVQLIWQPVAGSASYNVKLSTNNGGPYWLALNTALTNNLITGLTVGTNLFFVVTAINSGVESPQSEQVSAMPWGTKFATFAGVEDDPNNYYLTRNLSSNAVSHSLPGYLGENRYVATNRTFGELRDYGLGNPAVTSLGGNGFTIWDYNAAGKSLTNLVAGYTMTTDGNWQDGANANRIYNVDGLNGSNSPAYGILANGTANISITVPDMNYHVLTLFFSDVQAGATTFTDTLLSTNGDSASYTVTDSNWGISHAVQFLFKGNVTNQVTSVSGTKALLQAAFLDNAPTNLPPQQTTGVVPAVTPLKFPL